jgi:hypothetical protein
MVALSVIDKAKFSLSICFLDLKNFHPDGQKNISHVKMNKRFLKPISPLLLSTRRIPDTPGNICSKNLERKAKI